MNRYYQNSFWRDVKKIIDPALWKQVEQAILSVQQAQTIKDIPRLKKMKGHTIYYRIKVGRYRIGVTIEGNLATFARCLPRKDFYKYYP